MTYDRQGNPMDSKEWAALLEKDRRVAETTLPDGTWISTVWLGLDHSFGSGPPLIFETMVFPSNINPDDQDCDRYSTEAEAIEGHQRVWLTSGPSRERKNYEQTKVFWKLH